LKHLYDEEATLGFNQGSDGVAIATLVLPAIGPQREAPKEMLASHLHA
jgi:hypothetical protein